MFNIWYSDTTGVINKRDKFGEEGSAVKDRAGAHYSECVTVVPSLEQECIHTKLATFTCQIQQLWLCTLSI